MEGATDDLDADGVVDGFAREPATDECQVLGILVPHGRS